MRPKPLNIAEQILVQILETKLPFNLSIKSAFKKNPLLSNDDKKAISSLCGGALRHYYVFKCQIDTSLPQLELNAFVRVWIYLTDLLFTKRFDQSKTLAFANELLTLEQNENLTKLSQISLSDLIPNEYDMGSFDFLSLRFNTPSWLIKIWDKHYGKNFTYKTLKANSKVVSMTFRINESLIDRESFLNSNPNYEAASINNMVTYIGQGNPRKSDAVNDGKIFPFSLGQQYLMSLLDIDIFKDTTMYIASNTNLYIDLYARFGKSAKAELIFGTTSPYFEAKSEVEKYGLEGIKLYQAKASSVITCVSRPVHTFIVCPNSTNYSLLRLTPDYFLRISLDNLDALIKEQQEALEECAKFVEVGGQLVYVINTISKKEGNGVVESFLKNHPNFILEEEKQLFPFDPYETTMYFAIMRNNGENND